MICKFFIFFLLFIDKIICSCKSIKKCCCYCCKNNKNITLDKYNEKHLDNNENNDKKNENIKLTGLENFSLNCYMNSLLQCFYNIDRLRENFIDQKKYNQNSQKICYYLTEVMYNLKNTKEKSYSPTNFKKVLGDKNNLFKGNKGADVTDLYRTIIDSILEEIPAKNIEEDNDVKNYIQKQCYENAKKEINQDNPVIKELNFFFETIYDCPNKKEIKCYSVQNDTSIIFELLKISNFLKKEKINIYDCFDYNYRYIENNVFHCSNCECTHKNSSKDKLLSLPKVLTLILNRGKGKIYSKNIDIYEKINIEKYVDNTFINEKDRKYNYRLIGVVQHIGESSNNGHYVAYCYVKNKNKYYLFNDTNISETNFDNINKDGNPYILFYKQID